MPDRKSALCTAPFNDLLERRRVRLSRCHAGGWLAEMLSEVTDIGNRLF